MYSQPNTVVRTSQGPKVGPYIFGKTLGTGATAKVKLAKHCETGKYVAVKIVRKDILARRPSWKKNMRREITVMKLVDHPNVLKLLEVFEIDTHLFLVMEFVDGCELFEYLEYRGSLPNDEALDFFQQLIYGLEYCHKRLICHRDLKPENLLLSANRTLRIADFGMTSLNRPGSLLETSCGSPHYCSPAVISGEPYDGLKADIWSCGVILYAMLTGRLPFHDDNMQRLLLKVQSGRYRIPASVPADAQSLIRAMLVVDPEKRITIKEIKQHPWFTRRPPTNYLRDDFELPMEPITNLDMNVVQGLVDLGWGSKESIVLSLASADPSLEKVCYCQLSRHSSFRNVRSTSSRNAAKKGEVESMSANLAKIAIKQVKTGQEKWIPSYLQRTREDLAGREEEKNGSENADQVKPSHSALIRQSSLARNKVEEDDPKLEEAIKNSPAQKSWFDTLRSCIPGAVREIGSDESREDRQAS